MSKFYEFIRPYDGAQIGEQVAGSDFAKKKLGKAADLLKDGIVRIVDNGDAGTPDETTEEPATPNP